MRLWWCGWLAAAMLVAPTAAAQECDSAPPEWVFCDGFEDPADVDGNLANWEDQGLHPANLVLTSDPAIVHAGQRSLEITAHQGQDTGGGPTKWFLPGHDEVYVRFWVRFEPNYNYTHHLVNIGANQMNDQWASFGMAGCRPNGANFFTSSIEPFGEYGNHPPPGAWGMYSYSVNMACDPGSSCSNYADPQQICNDCANRGSPCNNGLECCWGANNISDPPAISSLGAWSCIEARVAANSGGQANGTQSLWVDGVMVGDWSAITWRTDDNLKINSLGLWHYVTDDSYASGQTEQTIWFDDVVISTAPIGCGDVGNPATGASSSGSSGAGAGSSGGGSGSGGANGAEPGAGDDSGCGCHVVGRSSNGAAAWLLVGAAWLLWRRRR